MESGERPRPETLDFAHRAFPGAELTALAGDASQRRFFRLRLASGETRVLMDYGKAFDGDTDDVVLTAIFREASLPVPAIQIVDGESGCLVLEDLGDRTLFVALEHQPRPADLLRGATLLAVDVAVRGTPVLARSSRAADPALDEERFRFEMGFFVENYVERLRGVRQPSDALRSCLNVLARAAAETPTPVLCHRDYHSRNLMVGEDGRLTMVDIQDARRGPDTYDLASLLWDAYIDIPAPLRERLLETYRLALPSPPAEAAFRRRFDLVAAQRMIKALGTFGYQIAALGRQRYGEGIPRTLRRLDRLLRTRDETRDLHWALSDQGLFVP
jgi:aminoglycoside/choline kinase family phosphotransferase